MSFFINQMLNKDLNKTKNLLNKLDFGLITISKSKFHIEINEFFGFFKISNISFQNLQIKNFLIHNFEEININLENEIKYIFTLDESEFSSETKINEKIEKLFYKVGNCSKFDFFCSYRK